jgi:hypothetical protein
MWKKIGFKQIMREGEGGGTGGGGGGGNPPSNPPSNPPALTAPWQTQDGGVWKIGEGEAAKPWHEFIPEPEAKAHLLAKGYKSPAELALANYNLTRLQTGDPTVVGLPAADAPPEKWNEFYNKLGRPETPDKYDIKFAEGFTPDEGMLNWAKPTFHEAGLTPKQAQILSDKWNAYVAETNQRVTEADAAANQGALDALATKWGGDLDKNKAAGQRAMQALGIAPELVSAVEQHIGSAAIVELLATIGRKADEGGFLGGNTPDPNNPDTMTRDQAQARINALQADKDFQAKYTDKNNPGHADAVQTMVRLYARI